MLKETDVVNKDYHIIARNLESEIHSDRFFLRRQPIISLSEQKNRLMSYEVLTGINTDDGLMEIAPLIAALDIEDRTKELDMWVVNELAFWCKVNCEELKEIDRIGETPLKKPAAVRFIELTKSTEKNTILLSTERLKINKVIT